MLRLVEKRKFLTTCIFVGLFSSLLLCYGYRFDSMYGVIDSNFEELSSRTPDKFLNYWDETRGAGELQSMRFPELVQSTYIYIIKQIFPNNTIADFAKVFVLNLLIPVSTLFCLYSFSFLKRKEMSGQRYITLALLSMFSLLNPAFLQSGMNTLLFQKFDYVFFCLTIYVINLIIFCSRGYLFGMLLLLFSFGTWHQFPYWLPYLAIIISYVLYLFVIKKIETRRLIIITAAYFFVSLPSLFSILYYLLSIDLSSSNQGAYTQEVFLYANSNSVLFNSLSFIAGANWGRVWYWTGEQFYRYFDLFTTNPVFLVVRFIPIALFAFAFYLVAKKREIIAYIFSLLVVLYYFIIPANAGPFGWLYTVGFQHSLLFQIYRESHNKFLFPTIALITLVIFLATEKQKKSQLYTNIFLSVYISAFVFLVSTFSLYSEDAFFKVPNEYFDIKKYIDDRSTVLVLPQYSTIQTFEYKHFGVNPIEYTIINPTLMIYYALQSRYNNQFLDTVLNDFNTKRGFGPSARGGKDAQYSDETLSNTNINYIILDGNVTGIPDFSSEDFLDLKTRVENLNTFIFLKRIGNLYIYTRMDGKRTPLILGENIEYQKGEPSRYFVRISDISSTVKLDFLQSFDPGWKIYLLPYQEKWKCTLKEGYSMGKIKECLGNNSKFSFLDLKYLFGNGEYDGKHTVSFGYANHWEINTATIKNNYPDLYIHTNSDGTKSIDIELYYRPQSFLIASLLISIAGLLICGVLFFKTFVFHGK